MFYLQNGKQHLLRQKGLEADIVLLFFFCKFLFSWFPPQNP